MMRLETSSLLITKISLCDAAPVHSRYRGESVLMWHAGDKRSLRGIVQEIVVTWNVGKVGSLI